MSITATTISGNTQRVASRPSLGGSSQSNVTAGQGESFDMLMGVALALENLEQDMLSIHQPLSPSSLSPNQQSGLPLDEQAGLQAVSLTPEDAKDRPETGTEMAALAGPGALGALSGLSTRVISTPSSESSQLREVAGGTTRERVVSQSPTNLRTPVAAPEASTTSPSGRDQSHVWQVRELSHQLNMALRSLTAHTPGMESETSVHAQFAGSFESKVQADRMGEKALANLVAGSVERETPAEMIEALRATDTRNQAQQQGAGSGLENLAEKLARPLSAGRPAGLEAPAATQAAEALDHAADVDPALNPAGTQRAQWTARPLAEADGSSRMPTLSEQIKQVSEFLAERTEGVVKLGDRGVEANLKLYPPDLGQVRVELKVSADRTLSAQFIVERPETAQMLSQHMKSFQDKLGQHGLVVDKIQVSVQQVSGASGSHESQWRQPDSSANQQRREGFSARDRQDRQREGGRGWAEQGAY